MITLIMEKRLSQYTQENFFQPICIHCMCILYFNHLFINQYTENIQTLLFTFLPLVLGIKKWDLIHDGQANLSLFTQTLFNFLNIF